MADYCSSMTCFIAIFFQRNIKFARMGTVQVEEFSYQRTLVGIATS